MPSPEAIVLSPSELLAWDMYFATVVGMQMHPGFRTDPDLARCAYFADRMLIERRKR